MANEFLGKTCASGSAFKPWNEITEAVFSFTRLARKLLDNSCSVSIDCEAEDDPEHQKESKNPYH